MPAKKTPNATAPKVPKEPKEPKVDLSSTPEREKARREKIKTWAQTVELSGHSQGMNREQIAEYLGLSYGYFSVLVSMGGGQTTKHLSPEVIERSAALLQTSVLNVYLMCGTITQKHLYAPINHEVSLEAAYETILQQPNPELQICVLSRTGWSSLSVEDKYAYILAFEIASSKIILEKYEILLSN